MVKLTHTHSLSLYLCVCVCVCEQTEGDVLAQSFQTQAVSTISQLMIFSSKNELVHTNKTPRHKLVAIHKPETPIPVYLGMKLHCCCTLHLASQSIWEKGGQKWDIWGLFQETQKQPMFPYWSFVLELELSILQFTQSIPTANFKQFIQTLTKL